MSIRSDNTLPNQSFKASTTYIWGIDISAFSMQKWNKRALWRLFGERTLALLQFKALIKMLTGHECLWMDTGYGNIITPA